MGTEMAMAVHTIKTGGRSTISTPPSGLSRSSAVMHPIGFNMHFSKTFACMHGFVCDDECHPLLPPSLQDDVLIHPFAFVQQMIPVSVSPLLRYNVMVWIYMSLSLPLQSDVSWDCFDLKCPLARQC